MRRPQECPETNLGAYMRERDHTGPDTTKLEMQMMCKKEGLEGEEKREKSAPLVVPPKKKKRERESGTEDTSSAPLLPGFMTYKTAILSRCARGFHTVSIARALFHTHTHARRARREMLLSLLQEWKRKQKIRALIHLPRISNEERY